MNKAVPHSLPELLLLLAVGVRILLRDRFDVPPSWLGWKALRFDRFAQLAPQDLADRRLGQDIPELDVAR